jgi:hypothetical protein
MAHLRQNVTPECHSRLILGAEKAAGMNKPGGLVAFVEGVPRIRYILLLCCY